MKKFGVRFEWLFLLAFFLLSCSKKEEYEMSISTEFTSRQIELVIAAIEQWERSCGIYVQVYVEDVSSFNTDVIYPVHVEEHLGFHNPLIDKIEIFIDRAGKSDPLFYNVVLHELGHWIGGLHTNSVDDIMYPTTQDKVWYRVPTENDLKSVCPWR